MFVRSDDIFSSGKRWLKPTISLWKRLAWMFMLTPFGMITSHFSNQCMKRRRMMKITEHVLHCSSREALGSFAESQKIAAVRKVYQKAIMNPMISVELLWKDYCNYEMVSIVYGSLFEFFSDFPLLSRVSIQFSVKISSKVVQEILPM